MVSVGCFLTRLGWFHVVFLLVSICQQIPRLPLSLSVAHGVTGVRQGLGVPHWQACAAGVSLKSVNGGLAHFVCVVWVCLEGMVQILKTKADPLRTLAVPRC